MKTFGIDSMFLDSPKYQGGFEQSWHDAVDRVVGPYEQCSCGCPLYDDPKWGCTKERCCYNDHLLARTECEHGVHVNELCPKCDPESALEAQQQSEDCSDMDIFHRY
jgi:hypothetical protein